MSKNLFPSGFVTVRPEIIRSLEEEPYIRLHLGGDYDIDINLGIAQHMVRDVSEKIQELKEIRAGRKRYQMGTGKEAKRNQTEYSPRLRYRGNDIDLEVMGIIEDSCEGLY